MKKWVRILCLVLVLAFILPALVACGEDDSGKNNSDSNKDNGGSTLELPDTIDGTTYGGKEFTIYSVEDMFEKKYFYADKVSGDGMNDALYERQQSVQKALDVKLVYKAAEGSGATAAYQQYATEVQNSIKSGQEKYQLVLSHAYYAIPTLVTGNSLKDFKEFDSVTKGINEDYWNKEIMDQLSYDGHYYLGYSNFNLARTYVIGFNKTIANNLTTVFKDESIYDMVNGGTWTISKMASVAEQAYEGNGDINTDTYGLTGALWVPFVGFIQSSGENIVVQNEKSGKYSISWDNNQTVTKKITNLVKQLDNLYSKPQYSFWKIKELNNNTEPTTVTLSSGRAFMQLMSTNELIGLKDTNVKFGVVPYPMYDKDQFNTTKYRSLNWAGYMCVPANITNANMVGDVIECLSYYSDDTTSYYYEKLLGRKVSEAPEDAEMLDIIWDSLCADFGVTYSMIDNQSNMDALVYSVPQCLVFGKGFSAHKNAYTDPAQNAIDTNINDKMGK